VYHLAFLLRFFYTYIAHFHTVLALVQMALDPPRSRDGVESLYNDIIEFAGTPEEGMYDDEVEELLGKRREWARRMAAERGGQEVRAAKVNRPMGEQEAELLAAALLELDLAVEMGYAARPAIEGAVREWGESHALATKVCEAATRAVAEGRRAGEGAGAPDLGRRAAVSRESRVRPGGLRRGRR
jgi:hypothetical protein